MNVLHIELHRHSAAFTGPDASYTVPLGSSSLADMIASDPPLPEELTNAIGIFMDHLEDVTREKSPVPRSPMPSSRCAGPGLQSLVDTEVGHSEGLPFDRIARRRRGSVPHPRHRGPRRPRPQPGPARRRGAPHPRRVLCAGRDAPGPAGSSAHGRQRCGGPMSGRGHPSAPTGGAIRLYGRRVMLRPLTAATGAVERGAPAQRAMAHPVGAAAPRQRCSTPPAIATRSVRAAAPRPRPPDGHRLRVRCLRRRRVRRRDQPQQHRARRAAVGTIGYWIDRDQGRARLHRRGRRGTRPVRVRATAPAPARDLHRAAQRQQPTRDGGAGASARKGSRCASSRSTARGKTTCATASPPRSGTPAANDRCRIAWPASSSVGPLPTRAVRSGLFGGEAMACAFALRTAVRRFQSFTFQCRMRLGAWALLAALGVVVVRRHPGSAWLVHLVGFVPGTHLVPQRRATRC
jgi:hypothetical protein